ncbi:sushi, von Willebrand factor type A, EGF and pentraxin domain-containing protein 1-like [Penaeus chinensis]|uniref:sushi, von Willebrand factor type A, EGF and pentraxin domain-containing protein 1-like n=1 Tax=Penaeus chinensis TaxID=139456 RepID=UPI001FB5D323|nr:sushi, von Willebrand factor type A, EGF and pentraxin domain-containing protein 1-like [Penaeus chinensis]
MGREEGRACLRRCSTDADCLSKRKICLCDGICGLSCIKPDKECGDLENPIFGFVEYNGKIVGSQARATISLANPSECAKEMALGPIPPRSATKTGYSTSGFDVAKCFLYNNTMQWFGPEIECEPKTCGDPGAILNGYKNSSCYAYSCRITYQCRPGFELEGHSHFYCQHDGSWSPRDLPACKPIQCPVPDNPSNGKAIYNTTVYNALLIYECNYGYMIVGPSKRRCGPDKYWSGRTPECREINCGSPGSLPNGYIKGFRSNLGATIEFHCNENMKYVGYIDRRAKCLQNGSWSQPVPKCLAPCIVPTIEDGRLLSDARAGSLVSDGTVIQVVCDEDFEPTFKEVPSVCTNGTWTHYPQCRPAGCKRLPERPRHGMVIAPQSAHGKRARYRCKDGYQLMGPATTECQFGNWTGSVPHCKIVYCPFPGYITNGQVMLVGNMGMYIYRPYVKKVRNNRLIRYECLRGYYLSEGPPGATCIAGKWSPKQLPKCSPKLHPRLNWIKRSVRQADYYEAFNQTQANASFPEEAQAKARFQDRFGAEYPPRYNADAVGGRHGSEWSLSGGGGASGAESKKKGKKAPSCQNLDLEPFLQVEVVRAGRANTSYASGTRVKVSCHQGYGLNIGNRTAKCSRGKWKPMKPECVTLPCSVPTTPHGRYMFNGAAVPQRATIGHAEVVKFTCESGYHVLGSNTVRCWYGDWTVTGKPPECQPDPCQLPKLAHGAYTAGFLVGSHITHGSSVPYACNDGWLVNVAKITCQLGQLVPVTPSCVTPAQATDTGSSLPKALKRVDSVMSYSEGDLTLGGDITGIDFLTNHQTSCSPPARVHGTAIFKNGQPVQKDERRFPSGTEITFNCISNTIGEQTSWTIRCEDGSWLGQRSPSTCRAEEELESPDVGNTSCLWRKSDPQLVTFYDDREVEGEVEGEVVEFQPGAELVSRCVDIGKYKLIGSVRRVCVNGQWTGEKPSCFSLNREHEYALDRPPTILFRHKDGPIAQTNDGKLLAYPGTQLYLECLWMRKYGTPRWNVSHAHGKYWTGWTTDAMRDPQLEYRLALYTTNVGDTGDYTCITPTGHSHTVAIDIREVDCPPLPPLSATKDPHTPTYEPKGATKLNSVVTFSCQSGYTLQGPGRIKCLPSGKWSDAAPACKKIECPPLEPPLHGELTGPRPHTAGDVLEVKCHSGYMMEGQPILVCQEDGQWSSQVPKCSQACTYPGIIISGTMSKVKFYYPIHDSVTYTCSDDFVLHGQRTITCLEGGRWSDRVPSCLPKP